MTCNFDKKYSFDDLVNEFVQLHEQAKYYVIERYSSNENSFENVTFALSFAALLANLDKASARPCYDQGVLKWKTAPDNVIHITLEKTYGTQSVAVKGLNNEEIKQAEEFLTKRAGALTDCKCEICEDTFVVSPTNDQKRRKK